MTRASVAAGGGLPGGPRSAGPGGGPRPGLGGPAHDAERVGAQHRLRCLGYDQRWRSNSRRPRARGSAPRCSSRVLEELAPVRSPASSPVRLQCARHFLSAGACLSRSRHYGRERCAAFTSPTPLTAIRPACGSRRNKGAAGGSRLAEGRPAGPWRRPMPGHPGRGGSKLAQPPQMPRSEASQGSSREHHAPRTAAITLNMGLASANTAQTGSETNGSGRGATNASPSPSIFSDHLAVAYGAGPALLGVACLACGWQDRGGRASLRIAGHCGS